MIIENVSFNAEWVASKTLKEFLEHEKHHGISEEKLREFHQACKALKKKAGKEGL